MRISNMKNIVVLNNLPSNIIEEAIVILKENQKITSLEFTKSKTNDDKEELSSLDNSDEYIVNEAEMLISDYINNLEKNKENLKRIELSKKNKNLKKIFITLFCMIISLLIFKIFFS